MLVLVTVACAPASIFQCINDHKIMRTIVCLLAVFLTACSTPTQRKETKAPTPPGQVAVYQSNYDPYMGTRYNPAPNVTIVKAGSVVTRNTLGAGLALVGSLLAGGNSPLAVSKDAMVGTDIVADNNTKITNPFLNGYSPILYAAIQDWLEKNPAYKSKTYENRVVIHNGHSRLVYEALTGSGSDQYRLHVSMTVSKEKERHTSGSRFQEVNCDYQSAAPKTEVEWKQNNHQPLREALLAASNSCTERVLASLPLLLAQ